MTFLQICITNVFFWGFQNPPNDFNVISALIFYIDKNIIQVNSNKNIKFFSQNLVGIALKASRYIGRAKNYYRVLKMAILSLKNYLLFVAFFNLYLIISTSQI